MASFTLTGGSRGGAQGSAWPLLLLLADPEEKPRGRHGLFYSYWWIQRRGPGVGMASFTLTGGSRGGAQGSAWPPLLLLVDPVEEPRGRHGLLYSFLCIQNRGLTLLSLAPNKLKDVLHSGSLKRDSLSVLSCRSCLMGVRIPGILFPRGLCPSF